MTALKNRIDILNVEEKKIAICFVNDWLETMREEIIKELKRKKK